MSCEGKPARYMDKVSGAKIFPVREPVGVHGCSSPGTTGPIGSLGPDVMGKYRLGMLHERAHQSSKRRDAMRLVEACRSVVATL